MMKQVAQLDRMKRSAARALHLRERLAISALKTSPAATKASTHDGDSLAPCVRMQRSHSVSIRVMLTTMCEVVC
jgi:hypothetical protein